MAARGGSIPVILDALKKREDERRALSAELDALKREPNVMALFQPHAVRRELHALLEEWQQLAAGEVDETRGVLSTVLRDRIAFHAEDTENGKAYRLTIPLAFDRVMRAVIPASNWNSVLKGFATRWRYGLLGLPPDSFRARLSLPGVGVPGVSRGFGRNRLGLLNDRVTHYQIYCSGEMQGSECKGNWYQGSADTYTVLKDQQLVLLQSPDGAPLRLKDCAVIDRTNRRCKTNGQYGDGDRIQPRGILQSMVG